jgi:hypothetical protein
MAESVKTLNRLSLSQARKTAQLQRFAEEQEALGVGPVSVAGFDAQVKTVATTPQSRDRTSRSPSHGGSTGKKIR